MLKIKLARFGKRGQPHYRIVVNEARDKRDGSYVESLGHYAPTQNPKTLIVDLPKYDAWLVKGAQPTETVASLIGLYRANPTNPFPAKKARPSKKAVAKKAAEAKANEEIEAARAAAKEAEAAEKAAPAPVEAEPAVETAAEPATTEEVAN
jgi:small subunit ribosomal protein S16